MNKRVLIVALLSLATVCVSAQKLSGDIKPLKGQKEVNVVIDFSGTTVNGSAEEKYIENETKAKNDEEKATWLNDWNENLRTSAYSMLTNDLNKAVVDNWFAVGNYPNAEYTINVKVLNITTGYFAGPMGKPSVLKVMVTFVKTGDTTPIATVEYKNSSSGISYTIPVLVTRIGVSFGKLGDQLADLINKQLKK